MLFRDFFPRLRDRASKRYGQSVTERQFKDWREDKLLPGRATPKGRGRGKSPEQHWPAASYRRALRICRYKFWGAHRQSQWWLGFWLSGEDVPPATIRAALKREFSIERRRNHAFIGSGRWRRTRFRTSEDADRGGIAGEGNVTGLLALTGMTPDQYRRLLILQLNDGSADQAEALIHELAPLLFDFGSELAPKEAGLFAEIKADISSDEIKGLWRSGHMDDRAERSGGFLDRISDSDLETCAQVLKVRERCARWNYFLAWIVGDQTPKRIANHLLPIVNTQATAIVMRISQIVRIAFEIDADIRDGKGSHWRLENASNKEQHLRMIISQNGSAIRENLLRFLEKRERL